MKRLAVLCLVVTLSLVATSALAQTGGETRVEVVLDANPARFGQIVNADVWLRPAVNVAGADIAIEVDNACLLVERMTPGSFFPFADEGRVFIPLQTSDQRMARLAANILGRENVMSAEGVFMRIPLRVLCESGQTTTVHISQADIVDDLGTMFTAVMQDATLTIVGGTVPTVSGPPWAIIVGGLLLLLMIIVVVVVMSRRRKPQPAVRPNR